MWLRTLNAIAVYALTVLGQEPETPLNLERTRQLVEQGSLPRNSLDEARAQILESQDQSMLRRTLYGSLSVEDLTEDLAAQMVDSARRLVVAQQQRVNHQRMLVEEGAAPRLSLAPFEDELELRRKTLAVAEDRARLWQELVEMAHAEEQRQSALEAEEAALLKASEEDLGYGLIGYAKLRQLETQFESTFGRPLPISAKGDTQFHRRLGFNHVGRVDVGLNPDSPEGRWLRNWLESTRVPYIAFRGAVPGKSSAAHIHIGPPSLRWRTTD